MTHGRSTVRVEYVPWGRGAAATWIRRAGRIGGAASIAGCLIWSLRPIRPPLPQAINPATPEHRQASDVPPPSSIDRTAFDAQIWTVVERPPEPDPEPRHAAAAKAATPSKPAPPPTPPRALVIAVALDSAGARTAFVFDSVSGDLNRVRVGDRMGSFQVHEISDRGVRLRTGSHTVELALDRGPDADSILREFVDE